jgi:hypothetical protein
MYTIRHAGAGKGFGVFASTRIPQGTRIMAERPLLQVRNENEILNAFRRLGRDQRRELLQLSVSPIQRSSFWSWTENAWHVARQAFMDLLKPNLTSTLEYTPTILGVFRNNNFDLGEAAGHAVFREISRLNHACLPNAQANWLESKPDVNEVEGRFTIHATRGIEVDEEITISYLSEHAALRESRQKKLLLGYGFLCDCPACNTSTKRGKEGEARRLRMQARLHAYAEEAGQAESVDPIAELDVLKDMLKMYRLEGIAGREVATMYLAAAELAGNAGRREEAAELAEKGVSLDRDCCGEDSPLYQASLGQAQVVRNKLLKP